MDIIMQIFIYFSNNNFSCDKHLTCDKRAFCDRGCPVSLAFGERSEPIASRHINLNNTVNSRLCNGIQMAQNSEHADSQKSRVTQWCETRNADNLKIFIHSRARSTRGRHVLESFCAATYRHISVISDIKKYVYAWHVYFASFLLKLWYESRNSFLYIDCTL